MSPVKKTMLFVAMIACMAMVGASSANAATTSFSCTVKGQLSKGTWTANCTSSLGNPVCSGTSTKTQPTGTLSGSCTVSSIFGAGTCTASGTYNAPVGAKTWTGSLTANCKAGGITANCTGSGGGSANPKTTAYSGSMKGTCTY